MPDKLYLLKTKTKTDEFREMPLSAQALYFHFVLEAGLGGGTDHIKSIMKTIGATDEDLYTLIKNGFVDCVRVNYTGALRLSGWMDIPYIDEE